MPHSSQIWIDQLLHNTRLHRIVLLVFPFIIYCNTLGHDFVLDDGIVITENNYVKKGLEGIWDLLTRDSFHGFFQKEGKEKLVAGGRYRPLSLMVFALTFQIFGSSAFIFHLLSILSYALLGLVMYRVLAKLLSVRWPEQNLGFAFFISILFLTHPIHTECVANIKGMDETLALLFSLLSLGFFIDYGIRPQWQIAAGSGVCLLLALLSKENAISYLVLIPLAGLWLQRMSLTALLKPLGYLALATLIFLALRANTLGWNPFSKPSTELMNNPFIKLVGDQKVTMNFNERFGIISHCLYEYLRLMFWPHPLTHDYYPKHIPKLGLGAWKSIFGIVAYCLLMVLTWINKNRYAEYSFSIAAFLIPLFLVSNILFPVGTNMGERFLFMPSLGFSVASVFLMHRVFKGQWDRIFYACFPLILVYSVLTILRNPVWSDNETLFTRDAKVSVNSAKIHNGIAGVLLEKLPAIKDSVAIRSILQKSRSELEKALKIHPAYMEAQLQMGNIFYHEKNYLKAIDHYNLILKNIPEDDDAFNNLQLALRERGRQLGESGKIGEAKDFIQKALGMKPNDAESVLLMGVAEGSTGNNVEAIGWFQKAVELNAKNPQAYLNLGIAYQNIGDRVRADSVFALAKSMDPEILKKNGLENK